LAGPAPNYDMQRILSAKTPREAAMMSGLVSVVLNPVRYLLVAGLAILALAFFMPELRAQGPDADFELILPFVLRNYVPVGLLGILVAGLLAAFMSTFAATVNAAPAYVVNDIYRRYIKPDADEKNYVWASYIVALAFVLIGTGIGLSMPTLNDLIIWIVSALWGGYAAANTLKWYWWRFNGHGYFWGMAVGVGIALWLAQRPDISALYAFPAMFAATVVACIAGALLTPATDMDTLTEFYRKTRPWGFWGPVRAELEARGAPVAANTDFPRDMFNIAVGIVWQTSLIAAPIFFVIRDYLQMSVALVLAAAGTVILKFTWYDRLQDYPDAAEPQPSDAPAPAPAAVKGAAT
ncbi:MAG: sodium:solute symporter, partial [Caulobacterales bacterium]|nr:sodium:solute symporter [Caulobacterales bacterium]